MLCLLRTGMAKVKGNSTWLKLRNLKTQVKSSYFTFMNKCHQRRCLNLMLQLVGITGHDWIKPHTL